MRTPRVSTQARRASRATQPAADVLAACETLGLPTNHLPATVAAAALTTARLVRDRTATNESAYEIREQRLPGAELADRDRFAEALAAGDGDPGPTATLAAQDELAAAERRVAALDIAEAGARRDLLATIDRATPSWQPSLDADVEEARQRYRAAVATLRVAHGTLAANLTAAHWLRSPGANHKGIVAIGMLPDTENLTRSGYPLNTTDVLALLERLGESA
jgi:hypothetical protein